MRCFAALMTALLIIAGPGAGGILAQTTYDVPQAGDLDEVIDGADSGDFVRVSNNINDNEPYGAITMKAGVTVYAKAGESPKISGSGAEYAVVFPSNADTSTVLQGFAEITAGSYGCILLDGTGVVRRDTIVCADAIGVDIYGTTAEVSECVIEGTSGFGVASSGTDSRVRDTEISMTAGTGVLVGYSGYAEVEGCRIEGGTVGVYCSEARASVTGCTITDQFSGGIQIQSTALAYPSEISDNILASEDETSSGISIYTPYLEVNVSGNTIDGWGTGILISSADPTTFGVVGNVVVNAAVIGIECSGQYAIGVDCNDAYNNGPTGEENYDEDCAIYVKNFEEDPLFCGGRDPSLEE